MVKGGSVMKRDDIIIRESTTKKGHKFVEVILKDFCEICYCDEFIIYDFIYLVKGKKKIALHIETNHRGKVHTLIVHKEYGMDFVLSQPGEFYTCVFN